MGIFLLQKNKLRCPKCGGIFDKTNELTKLMNYKCFKCGCDLVTEDEYRSSGYHNSDKPRVECPYCHSTNTKKISTTSKAVNTAVFGILGTKRHKQWHCNECHSDF